MDKSQIDKLLVELQKDEKFRTEFLKDAVGTLKSKNYMLTAGMCLGAPEQVDRCCFSAQQVYYI